MPASINIDSRGYGKIYKAVMRNRQLPLLAKSIYAYFCAYAGNGNQAFPKRDKIVRNLNINKDTFTKHLSNLVSEGYIAKERTATGNLYTIVQTVPGYDRPTQADDEMTDMLIMESVGAQGFGTVPKLVMLDARLTAQAKAIYAYFASFAGAGTTAFPRRATIMRDLGLAPATYYSHFNLLLNFSYLSVERRKNNGRFDVSIYRLAENVDAPALSQKSKRTVSSEKPTHGNKGDNNSHLSDKGENPAPMSEKLAHGELLKTTDFMSEIPISEKPLSEKLAHENFGQANINNKSTSNISFENEQGENHQGHALDDNNPVHLFSLEQTKALMRYDDLRCEALAWGELKDKLGHFIDLRDKARYIRKVTEVLDESARQIHGKLIAAREPQRITDMLANGSFDVFFDEVLDRWYGIASVKGYVGASINNMLPFSK